MHAERASVNEPRDRYADLLRVASILMVVVGHWLELVREHLRPLVPWAAWITWLFQVIPVFFFVGGSLNGPSWSRALARGDSWSSWVGQRAQRLFVPLGPLVAFWIVLVPVLLAARLPDSFVHLAAHAAFVPTWFLGVYVAIVALTPWTWRLHRRWGGWAVVGFFVAAFAVDALARIVPVASFANVVLVWAGVHQLGYLWRERRLPARPVAGLAMALAGLAALFALVAWAGYPVSMVALDEGGNNVSPPTGALFVLALVQVGLVVAARPAMDAALRRGRAWAGVRAVGSFAMTLFLWHMSAILLTGALAWALGVWPEAPDINASRWIARPAWLAVAVGLLALFVLAFRGYERLPARDVAHPATARTLAGLVATVAGVWWVERHGVFPPEIHWAAVGAGLLTLALGLAALGALRLSVRRAS